MQQHLRIGEMASRTGRSIHTIRWYEAQGLIPDVVRDSGGRRVYSEYHIRWLDLMERLRCTALAKQGGAMLEQRRALLAGHQVRVRENIIRWTEALALIDAKIEFYDEWMANGERPAVEPHRRLQKSKRALKMAIRS